MKCSIAILVGCMLAITLADSDASASYFGRFDIGAFSVIPDDSEFDARASGTARFTAGWNAPGDSWAVYADMRFRGESGAETGPHYLVHDLRADYGLGKSLLAGSVGFCRMGEVTGIGGVAGGQIQLNPIAGLSIGAFGGGNPFTAEGHTDIDGTKFGAYATFRSDPDLKMGIAFSSIRNTDQTIDERDIIVFDSQLSLASRLYVTHFGEITLSDDDESARLSYYYANARLDASKKLRLSLAYNHFEYLPYIQFRDEIEFYDQDGPPAYSRFAEYATDSLSPRIEYRITSDWRVFARYRHQTTDYFSGSNTDQWTGGFSCSDLFRSGIAFNGSFGSTDRGDRDFSNAYVSFSRDLGRNMNLTVGYAVDRFNRPESVFVSRHQESTQRVSASFWYRLNQSINLLVDYEKSFADSDEGDHQILFNVQYRLR